MNALEYQKKISKAQTISNEEVRRRRGLWDTRTKSIVCYGCGQRMTDTHLPKKTWIVHSDVEGKDRDQSRLERGNEKTARSAPVEIQEVWKYTNLRHSTQWTEMLENLFFRSNIFSQSKLSTIFRDKINKTLIKIIVILWL